MKKLNPIDDFKNFMFTQYFADGVKVTLGVLLPSLLFFQFGMIETGITLSLGALCVSIADTPGPWLHRKNGMLVCSLFIFFTALLTASINTNVYFVAVDFSFVLFVFDVLPIWKSSRICWYCCTFDYGFRYYTRKNVYKTF